MAANQVMYGIKFGKVDNIELEVKQKLYKSYLAGCEAGKAIDDVIHHLELIGKSDAEINTILWNVKLDMDKDAENAIRTLIN